MSELTEKILNQLLVNKSINTLKLASEYNEDHQKIIGALKSIEAHGKLVLSEPVNEKKVELTEEGKLIIDKGN